MGAGELMRVTPADFPNWPGAKSVEGAEWIMRVFNNLFPRIPEKLTGGRNESYIVIEDPRHFSAHPRSVNDLMNTGALGEEHFYQLLMVDRRLMQRVFDNRTVHSVVIRKNQGPESGASQPHLHQHLIGSPPPLPALRAQARARPENPGFWNELIAIVDPPRILLDKDDAVVSYANPI